MNNIFCFPPDRLAIVSISSFYYILFHRFKWNYYFNSDDMNFCIYRSDRLIFFLFSPRLKKKILADALFWVVLIYLIINLHPVFYVSVNLLNKNLHKCSRIYYIYTDARGEKENVCLVNMYKMLVLHDCQIYRPLISIRKMT